MKNIILSSMFLAGLTAMVAQSTDPLKPGVPTNAAEAGKAIEGGETKQPAKPKSANEIQARRLLDEAKAKILGLSALVVDVMQPTTCHENPSKNFARTGIITLQRPNKFRIEKLVGTVHPKSRLVAVSDGENVTRLDDSDFVAYQKPVRSGAFFMGQNFLVQFFFDNSPIRFDPTDPIWGKSVSLFDKNYSAYDRDTQLKYLGKRTMEGSDCDVVEIKYNTPDVDIRQQVYLDETGMLAQVDTNWGGDTYFEKYRNFQTKFPQIGAATFKLERPEKMPLVNSDPARLGEKAVDFKLPGAKGEPAIALKDLLERGKGVFICALDTYWGWRDYPDIYLGEMKLVQEIKNKFEGQGLQIVVVFGGPSFTPDLKQEMLLNWVPDLTRFNYPIALDIDVERGIQGSAYENLQVNGRHTLLLDKAGRVVFACNDLAGFPTGKGNQLALYQALSQIGFSVSQADLEKVGRR